MIKVEEDASLQEGSYVPPVGIEVQALENSQQSEISVPAEQQPQYQEIVKQLDLTRIEEEPH